LVSLLHTEYGEGFSGWNAIGIVARLEGMVGQRYQHGMTTQPVPGKGTPFSIVLLLLPFSFIGWAVITKVQFPFNQLEYLKLATAVSTTSFLIAWYFSFWKIRREKVMIPITLFLYLLWTFGISLGIANANREFDQSIARVELRKVIGTRTTGSGGGRNSSKSYCLATLAEPLDCPGKANMQ